jgi:hypothetical protein
VSSRRVLQASLIPLLLVAATGTVDRCRLSTESGTGELRISGTVSFVEASGGCWRLDADGGSSSYELLPDQAPSRLLRHGARVTVTAELGEASASGCRVGRPLVVHRIVAVEA